MYIPKLFVCLREGYTLKKFQADLGAGMVVGLVALPLAMAFAIASGLPPERGIYTAVVAGFLISALGGSRVQIGGPTGAFVVIVSGIVTQFGYEGLVIATLMAGVLLIVMGVGRFGAFVKYIPHPVTTGFTSGIAVIIFSSQVKDFLGLTLSSVPVEFVAKWHAYALSASTCNPWSLILASGTLLIMVFWPKAWRKVPSPIVAMTAMTLLAIAAHWPVETIGSRFGGIPRSLPHLSFPSISWAQVKLLFPSAITVAMLGAIESLLSAVVADGMIGSQHKSNVELVSQGIANLASPLFGGLPATGAIARTATNVNAGGRTPVAGMVHAGVLLVILMVAGPLAERVPLAVLSGILVMVAYHMAEWRSFRFHMSGPMSDRLVLLTTFLLTVFVDLTVAVEVGLVLAAFLFMRTMAELTHVKEIAEDLSDGKAEHLREVKIPADVQVFSIHGAFFFAAAHKILEVERNLTKAPRALILDLTAVLHMDSSGLHVLERIRKECVTRRIRLVIAGLHAQPLITLQDSDQFAQFEEKNLTPDLKSALHALKTA